MGGWLAGRPPSFRRPPPARMIPRRASSNAPHARRTHELEEKTLDSRHRSLAPRSHVPLGAAAGLAVLLLVGAIGCATPRYDAYGNLYYEHHPHRRAAEGAVVGGLAGAGLGAVVADRHHEEAGFWIGGALGALTGAAIGDAIDRREHERRHGPPPRRAPYDDRYDHDDWHDPHDRHDDRWDDARGDPGDDWARRHARRDPPPRRGDAPVVLAVPGEVLFAPGSDRLSPGAERRLREVARALRRHPGTRVVVRGHADGSEPRRTALSEARAAVVREHLLHHGVPPSRVTALGYGDRFPLAANATPEGRQRNRRAEIEIRAERGHDLARLW